MNITLITDKNQLYSFFKKNLCYFSYHIGDMDDFFFKNCLFYALINQKGQIADVCLVYKGLRTPTILAFGLSPDYNLFLNRLIESDKLPETFFGHFFEAYKDEFLKTYSIIDLGLHYKMYLVNRSKIDTTKHQKIVQLNRSHSEIIHKFYKESYPDTYFELYMLDTGKYYGLFNEFNELVSVAGVHTFAEKWKLAVIGNVATHPDHQGKGYAYSTINYLVSKLLPVTDFISLNVKSDNNRAISLYERLGFKICSEYREGMFQKERIINFPK